MKKTLLFFSGLILYFSVSAQNSVVYEDEQIQIIDSVQATFDELVDSIFTHLDLSRVSSGILIDRTLSTLDYGNFSGQPTILDTASLGKWRHLYNVFYKNARNEAEKWQADLQDSLAVMDSLMQLRDLPGEKSASTLPCDMFIENVEEWKSRYEQVKDNVLEASEQYPPRLPRIRKWINHSDSLLQAIYDFEADPDFTVLNDSNQVNFFSWTNLYELLNQAALDPQTQPLPDLQEALSPYLEEGQPIPLVFLDMRYHRIKPDAIERNLLRFEGIQLHEVEGNSESPFEEINLLAVAPAAVALEGTHHTFVLQKELMFGNQTKPVKNIAIDFGDGLRFREVNFDEVVSVQYPDTGEKYLRFKVTYENCSFSFSHANLLVQEPPTSDTGGRTADFRGVADEEFHLVAERPYEGGIAGGNVIIEYGCGNDRLMKPFIIVEGFDPEQFGIFEEDKTYKDFRDRLNIQNRDLLLDLQSSGYDLVYLDYDDGGTYIERNAYLLQALIKKVNEMKATNGSTEPNVVMGNSMGGLVSRFALADMEQREEEHDTRLLISFDSPHWGANVPMGFQIGAYQMPEIRIGRKTIQERYNDLSFLEKSGVISPDVGVQLMNNPAARQMMKQQASAFSLTPVDNNLHHSEFMRKYHELGPPVQCRNIAISNGSQKGVGQGFEPGDLLFHFQTSSWRASAYTVINLAEDLGFNDVPVLGGIATSLMAVVIMPAMNILVGYRLKMKIWSLENYSSDWQTIYEGKVFGRILFLPIAYSSMKVRVKKKPAIDAAPGGRINYAQPVDISRAYDLYTGTGAFCFIPTVSALALDETFKDDLYLNVQESDIIANTRTYLENYAAPDESFNENGVNYSNEFHVSFSPFNSKLFQQELIGAGLPGISLSGGYYNFGGGQPLGTTNRIGGMTISTDGQLFVNANLPIGPAEDADENQTPPSNSTFDVQVLAYNNCSGGSGEVEVMREGEIILGDEQVDNTGVLRFRQGATLLLKSGSKLVINGDSKLVIECGAMLVFEEGAEIIAAEDGSGLVIDGSIELSEGTNFPYAYVTGTGGSPSPDVAGITIEGPEWLCSEGSFYQLSELPEGTEVCWVSEDPSISIEGAECGNQVLFRASSSTISVGVIKAYVSYSGACNDLPPSEIVRTVNIGTISPSDITITGAEIGETVCPNTTYTFKAFPDDQQEYQWTVQGIGTIVSGQNTNTITVATSESPAGAVSVAIDNGCGFGHAANKTLQPCTGFTVSAFPVPTDGFLNISVSSFFEEPGTDGEEEYEFMLYSDQSVLVRHIKSKEREVILDVSGLSPKVYMLQVVYKGKSASRKVLIGKS